MFRSLVIVLSFCSLIFCTAKENSTQDATKRHIDSGILARLDTAIFASGCFWCTEAVFERIKGVEDVVSGYSGGTKSSPTYEEVSAGLTNYAEAVRVLYDPQVVTYLELVEMFFASHDPTQLNRQGPDIGKQYRSAIFYKNESEKSTAEEVMQKLTNSGKYDKPIVTEITKFTSFYEAETYHQNYYELHPDQPYVASVSRPKVEKFMKEYKHKLKEKYR
nr:peptide-methionine (S)-S-oxide reductase MsrA [Fulvivirga imtechensis]